MIAAEIGSLVVAAGLDPLSAQESVQFATYLELLLRWNAKLNLTAIREPEAIVRRHFLESIQCARVLPKVKTLLDFGSGAGLPGIPVAICRPEISITLGESQAKKVAFLREVVRTLQLVNAEVFDGRVELMSPSCLFEAVVLRAVDRMADACREAAKLVAPGGWLLAFATETTAGELQKVLPQLIWGNPVRTVGIDKGFLLIGQNVPRETSPKSSSSA